MNELKIPFEKLAAYSSFDEIDAELSSLPVHHLEHLLWSNDGYKPKVSFSIAHNSECVFLKFIVEEDNVSAVYNNTNDPVYKDSCVEFFVRFEDDNNYYNLEFNRLGTCTMGYGANKFNRELLPNEVIETIRSKTKLDRVYKSFVYLWEISLVIPACIFIHHSNIDLNSKTCRLNFYKCGDDLPQPHFLAWNNIESADPNFHLPEYFGKGLFLNQ